MSRRDSPWPPVLAGGLLAGALDITYACLFWAIKADLPPTRIFQSVAATLRKNRHRIPTRTTRL